MAAKILMSFVTVFGFSFAAFAETSILCDGTGVAGQSVRVTYVIEAKTIRVQTDPNAPWKVAFDSTTACGRVADFQCEHSAHNNLDDVSSPNKYAYDSIMCSRHESTWVHGQIQTDFFSSGGGHFWCSIRGTRVYNLKLSNCRYTR